jgi:iron complex transport system substrate-binding protein
MHWLADRPDFGCLKAVRGRRLFLADGNQYFNRPGPRIVETFEIIAAMLHGVGVEGPAWAVYSN